MPFDESPKKFKTKQVVVVAGNLNEQSTFTDLIDEEGNVVHVKNNKPLIATKKQKLKR